MISAGTSHAATMTAEQMAVSADKSPLIVASIGDSHDTSQCFTGSVATDCFDGQDQVPGTALRDISAGDEAGVFAKSEEPSDDASDLITQLKPVIPLPLSFKMLFDKADYLHEVYNPDAQQAGFSSPASDMTISYVGSGNASSALQVSSAVWLSGAALMGFISISRRTQVS